MTRQQATSVVCAVWMAVGATAVSAQTTGQSQATDPSVPRKGFIIGVGGGAALHRADDVTVIRDRLGRVTGVSSVAANNLAIVTDFKVGYAPTDQLLFHYTNKVAFTQAEDYDYVGLTGGGVTYMFRPSSPSFFVTGSAGVGIGGTLVTSTSADRGDAFNVGAGYEFARHFSLSGDAMFVRLGGGNNHTALTAMFHYLFY